MGGTSGTSGGATGSSNQHFGRTTTQPVDTTPQAVTIGNSKLIADQRANSIIVFAPARWCEGGKVS